MRKFRHKVVVEVTLAVPGTEKDAVHKLAWALQSRVFQGREPRLEDSVFRAGVFRDAGIVKLGMPKEFSRVCRAEISKIAAGGK